MLKSVSSPAAIGKCGRVVEGLQSKYLRSQGLVVIFVTTVSLKMPKRMQLSAMSSTAVLSCSDVLILHDFHMP